MHVQRWLSSVFGVSDTSTQKHFPYKHELAGLVLVAAVGVTAALTASAALGAAAAAAAGTLAAAVLGRHSSRQLATSVLLAGLLSFAMAAVWPMLDQSSRSHSNVSTLHNICQNYGQGRPGVRHGVCTFVDADKHFVCRNAYPLAVTWAEAQNVTHNVWTRSQGCRDDRGACVFDSATNETVMTILGDSQGQRVAGALQGIVESLPGVVCGARVTESSAAFYNVNNDNVVLGRQDCSGCTGFRTTCTRRGQKLHLEYLRMEYVLDFELAEKMRIHWDNNCRMDQNPPCKWAWSTQQFLFELYLAKRSPAPQHIHIFQNIHDCARRTPPEFGRDLAWFMQILHKSLPDSSHVYFWEAMAPNPIHQGIWANVTSASCVLAMNKAVQAIIKPHVAAALAKHGHVFKGPSLHATFGLFAPTAARLDLNTDGVHFVPEWYTAVAKTLLSGTCG